MSIKTPYDSNIFHTVRVEKISDHIGYYRVIVDGEELHHVAALNISYEPMSVPKADITLNAVGEIPDSEMAVYYHFETEDIRECVRFLALQLQLDEDFREAWKSSIYSALADLDSLEKAGAHHCNYDRAAYILERLIR